MSRAQHIKHIPPISPIVPYLTIPHLTYAYTYLNLPSMLTPTPGMPDALSKTIPIWCCVLNTYLFPANPEYHTLHTPPQVVSASEHAQIAALIPSFVASLRALALPIDTLRQHITKPLRPTWITPESHLPDPIAILDETKTDTTTDIDTDGTLRAAGAVFADWHPIICCTASRRIKGLEGAEGGYVQGAGDDTENWARGLTAELFWEAKDRLLRTSEEELPDLIAELVSEKQETERERGGRGDGVQLKAVEPTSSLFVAAISDLPSTISPAPASPPSQTPPTADPHPTLSNDTTSHMQDPATENFIILLAPTTTPSESWTNTTAPRTLIVGLGTHKVGSRNLRAALPVIDAWLRARLADARARARDVRIVVACPTGKDFAVGVALMILCAFYDEQGRLLGGRSEETDVVRGATGDPAREADAIGHAASDVDIEAHQIRARELAFNAAAASRPHVDKLFIRQRLTWLTTAMPAANPSRNTLQSVNAFLMSEGS